MIATWGIEFKTGYDLTDNDRYRIRERIAEALAGLAEEYMANIEVKGSHFIVGPAFRNRAQLDESRMLLAAPAPGDKP
jgi:hypothetical protein